MRRHEFEQLTRQNMQMLERAMRMFSPFGGASGQGEQQEAEPAPEHAASRNTRERKDEIEELKDQIEAMRRQLTEIAQRK